jgi:hypothetical protein
MGIAVEMSFLSHLQAMRSGGGNHRLGPQGKPEITFEPNRIKESNLEIPHNKKIIA